MELRLLSIGIICIFIGLLVKKYYNSYNSLSEEKKDKVNNYSKLITNTLFFVALSFFISATVFLIIGDGAYRVVSMLLPVLITLTLVIAGIIANTSKKYKNY